MRVHHAILTLCVLITGLLFRDLGARELFASHEARAAQNAQRMIDDQSWGLPRLYDDEPDYQKPPGFYWLVACLGSLNGGVVDAWCVRLPAALLGAATVFLLFFFLHQQGRTLAGFLAGLILLSAIHFTGTARVGRIDVPLTFAIAATLIVARAEKRSYRWCAIVPLALAIMLKGPIGIALPVAVWIALRFASRWFSLEIFFRPTFWEMSWISIGSIAFAAPWFIWANHVSNGEFWRVFFWHHNVDRATGSAATLASHPGWYYVPRFMIDFLPWTPLLLVASVRSFRQHPTNDGIAVFAAIWFLGMFALLSLARFKRADYLLPAYPGAALFLGCYLERLWYQTNAINRSRSRRIFHGLIVLLIPAHLLYDHVITARQEAERAQRSFATAIRQATGHERRILLFRVESHLLVYHLRRPVHTLVEWHDLNQELAKPGQHYFVTRQEFLAECLAHVKTRSLEVVCRSGDFCSVAPLRPLILVRTTEIETPPCPRHAPKD